MTWSTSSIVHRALREPTVHFALLAACLFGVRAAATSWNRPVVEIDPRSVEHRIRQLERGRGAPLNDTERRMAEQAYIDEQILSREARARGLDDDERIRAILYQKMLQILGSDVPQPTEAELRAYFDRNRARYARRPSVTVEDLFVPERFLPRSLEVRFDPDALELQGRLERSLLTRVTAGELAWSFGEETAAMVFGAAVGAWVGPHRASDGEHWFRVVERIEGGDAPPLEEVREQVRFDCMAEKERDFLQQRVEALRERYLVRYEPEEPSP